MIKLTIDGKHISMPPGSTVLDAAKWLGIRIPTMCHVPGIEPAGSCYVCAVQVEGRRTLSPACAQQVAEGMVVAIDTPDVRNARKMALELLLSDHAGECVAPCAARCPAGLDIPGFVYGIASGDNRRAVEVIAEKLALPGSLGRVCPRLCEQQCRRCEMDESLTIGALHRFATDAEQAYLPSREPSSGKSVAIIGAGPAGLAAAYYLLRNGHDCTLFDAHPLPGGMLRYGIPAYRLPRETLNAEIDIIRNLGAQFRMTSRWGVDFTLADLRREHAAVFVAIGAQRAQELRCEGEELAVAGVEFLEKVAEGNPPSLGNDVIVVGGGNTAIDCARSAVRLGARNVRVLYRRSRHEMPCLMEEVEAAEVEGVQIDLLTAPVRIEQNGDRVSMRCQRMGLGEPDGSGRRRPVAIEGSDFVIDCSTVIAAVGQSVDRTLVEREGLKASAWGISAEDRTLATYLPGVFAGGDAVLGADLAVRAVTAGRMAAVSIHQYLSGEAVTGETAQINITMQPIDEAERAAMFREIEKASRAPMGHLSVEQRRAGFDEVDRGLSTQDARREALRCLSCGCKKADCCLVRSLATEYHADVYRFAGARRRFSRDVSHAEILYEPGKCINCGACVRIAAAEGETVGLAITGRGFDVAVTVPFGQPLSAGLTKSAQRCAEACPSGALVLRSAGHCGLRA